MRPKRKQIHCSITTTHGFAMAFSSFASTLSFSRVVTLPCSLAGSARSPWVFAAIPARPSIQYRNRVATLRSVSLSAKSAPLPSNIALKYDTLSDTICL
jgi:hypothetical protein